MFFTVFSTILLVGWVWMFIRYLENKFTPSKFLTSVMFLGIIFSIIESLLQHLQK
jgi:hypothetical protein